MRRVEIVSHARGLHGEGGGEDAHGRDGGTDDEKGDAVASAGGLSPGLDVRSIAGAASRAIPQVALPRVTPWAPDTALVAVPVVAQVQATPPLEVEGLGVGRLQAGGGLGLRTVPIAPR